MSFVCFSEEEKSFILDLFYLESASIIDAMLFLGDENDLLKERFSLCSSSVLKFEKFFQEEEEEKGGENNE